jgi:subtilisin-like proprotein convertase family protein
MTKKVLFSILAILLFTTIYSQKSYWNSASKENLATLEKVDRASVPSRFLTFSLDNQAFRAQLSQAPLSGDSNVIVQFPDAEGKMGRFKMYQSEVMHPDLAAKYPDIKTYIGQGIDDASASIHVSTTIFGVHAMTLSGKAITAYIDPYTKDLNNYIVYSKDQLVSNRSFSCNVLKTEGALEPGLSINGANLQKATDGKFRTYRLAMACTTEYAIYHLNAAGIVPAAPLIQKKLAVLAAMNVSMARINGVYMRDMSLKMQLVGNNDLIIFVTSDNFSNNSAGALINESQTVIDAVIGSANYDIGHTVSTGGGGLAQLGSVCITGAKASGITGSPAPVGDAYDIDFVAHEIGHQFGANHTFSGDASNCGGNRNNSTAVEPGSGTTIMAYAGLCSPQDVAAHSDDHFHAVSLAEMFNHITGSGNCVPGVANGNFTPVIPALSNYTIPNGTAFKLTAPTVTDANNDVLTYCWEQNNGTFVSSPVPSATSTTGSNFRSYSPTTSLTRYFPKFSDVLASNLASPYEMIPTVARTMAFTLTVRDNRTPNGGQTEKKEMTLTFASGAPFAITSQNVDGIAWLPNTQQTITWTTGGVSLPVTTAVKISLSTDGGQTFPTVLAASTANDGSETISVPAILGQYCRIMIEPLNNIYYAINSKPFSVGYSCNTATSTPNLPVADGTGANAGGAIASTTLNVTNAQTISNMKVSFASNHTWVGDMVVKLQHGTGTQVTLWNRTCNNPQNSGINVVFQDGSPAIVCATPVTGTYSPVNPLSVFNGESTSGAWTLTVQDFYNGDTGSITTFGLDFGCVSLANESFELDNLSVYPNPNRGNFTVKFNSTTQNKVGITIHDMQGRRIFDNNFDNTGLFSQNIQLDNAQTGVYLVTVRDGDRKEVKRIVIE